MNQTSEYCALGHPDRTCDFITSYLLDRYLERDPNSRVALECQIKDNYVTLGGEVTSAYEMHMGELKRHVRDAICAIGYTPKYAARWGEGNCIDPDNLDIDIHIGQQSPDIAQGVDADGWGDQGIFWGMATGDERTDYMPLDHTVAKRLGMALYEEAFKGELPIGLDIKTQVTVEDGAVTRVIAAIPTIPAEWAEHGTPHFGYMVRRNNLVAEETMRIMAECGCKGPEPEYTINGTGAYVRHSTAGDCGTTGRKLAVDFYGGACRIGGGCPWGKDPTKADVTLNVYARHLALEMKRRKGIDTVYCQISCCIGRRDIGIVYLDGHLNEIATATECRPAREVIAQMGLRAPVWAFKCRNGLFAGQNAERA